MKHVVILMQLLASLVFLQAQEASISLKVFLQGAYQGNNLMSTALNGGGHLPLAQPYHTGIWEYPGTEALIAIPAGMVDWILIDLRSSPDTFVARKAAILLSDGTVTDVNGNQVLDFPVPADEYYIAIMHRSHLSTMTAGKHALPSSNVKDFSDTTLLPVFGFCLIDMGGGVMGMISGDINHDKVLKYSGSGNDRGLILQRILAEVGGTAINAITTGYFKEDLRMDGTVKYSGSGNDPSLIIQNINSLTGSTAINSVFTGPVPHAVFFDSPCTPQPDQADAGIDTFDIPGNTYPLQANEPLNGSGQWSLISGQGGSFDDDTKPDALFTGLEGESYVLVWTISTICGTNSDTVNISFLQILGPSCQGIPSFSYGGQTYNTVHIGSQCWMRENLNIGVMVNSVYTGSSHAEVSNNGLIEKYCFDNNPANCVLYGGLYDWNEMMDYSQSPGVQGICPEGWHIPTDDEWCAMTSFLDPQVECNVFSWNGVDVGAKIKEAGFDHWDQLNTGATNSSGFTALGTGSRRHDGSFYGFNSSTYFWTSTMFSSLNGISRAVNAEHIDIFRGQYQKTRAFSLRCVLDVFPICTPQPDQADAGMDTFDIPGNTYPLQANQPSTGSGQWSLISGQGGSFDNDTMPNALFTGLEGESYVLVWTVSTVCGSNEDTLNLSFAYQYVFSCGDTLYDERDGKKYATVQVGTQCWMQQNLNIGQKIISSHTTTPHTDASNNGIIEKYCYDDDTVNCLIYGGLYDWDEMMAYHAVQGVQGICPDAWHIPSGQEWDTLSGFLLDNLGGKLKDTGFIFWTTPNLDATNESGFTAMGAGIRDPNGSFHDINARAYFWTSTTNASSNAFSKSLSALDGNLMHSSEEKSGGFSVRCIYNYTFPCAPQPDQADAGPDVHELFDTIVQLQANEPLQGIGHWSMINGQGATLSDTTDPLAILTGHAGETYLLVWTISTACGSSSDTVVVSFAFPMGMPCPGIPSFTYEGQSYNTVHIGSQCWMRENLNVGVMATSVNTGNIHSDVNNNGIIEKYCFENDSTYCDIYGGLYDWNEMMGYDTSEGIRGICPPGWHIPTDNEWCILNTYLDPTVNCNSTAWIGTHVGGALKDTGFMYWDPPNTEATNMSGFTALGGTYRSFTGVFYSPFLKLYANFWTSTQESASRGMAYELWFDRAGIYRSDDIKESGYSVRCVWDTAVPCNPPPDQAYAGKDSLEIPGNHFQLHANSPMIGTGIWTILSGNGGSFVDSSLNNTVFVGLPGVSYSLIWSIFNMCGMSRDTLLISFEKTFVCGDTIIDRRDNRLYATIQVGTRCWMQENLNVGTAIQASTIQSNNAIIEKYCYDDQAQHCDIYGGLYRWDEMMGYVSSEGSQGICPEGWHVPGDDEWCALTTFLDASVNCGMMGWTGTDIGGRLKSTGLDYWDVPNTGADNSSGFSARGAGASLHDGSFAGLRSLTRFWSSSAYNANEGIYRMLSHDSSGISRNYIDKDYGHSVRCVHDSTFTCSPLPDQANAGPYPTGCNYTLELLDDYGDGWNGGALTVYVNDTIALANLTLSTGSGPAVYSLFVNTGDTLNMAYYPGSWASENYYHIKDAAGNIIFSDGLSGTVPQGGYAGVVDCKERYPDVLGDTILLEGNIPVNGQGQWSIIAGTGGSFSDATSPNAILYGQLGQTYTLVWTISTPCGSSSDTTSIAFIILPGSPCPGLPSFVYEGQTYTTVYIGSQCWMRENLNVGVMISSMNTGSSHADMSDNDTIEKYCYGNDAANCLVYGGLYEWEEMMAYDTTPGARGICPPGWHIPTDGEWCALTTYLDPSVNCNLLGWFANVAAGKMKETGLTHWHYPNKGATNESGFTALGAGLRNDTGNYTSLKDFGYFWSSSASSSANAIVTGMRYSGEYVARLSLNKHSGHSVRCLKDD